MAPTSATTPPRPPSRTTTLRRRPPRLRLLSKASTEQALPLGPLPAAARWTLSTPWPSSSPIVAEQRRVRRAFAGSSCTRRSACRATRSRRRWTCASHALPEAEAHERVVRAIHAREQLLELRHLAHVMISLDGNEQQRASSAHSSSACACWPRMATAVRRWRQRRARPLRRWAAATSRSPSAPTAAPPPRLSAAASARQAAAAAAAPLVPVPFVWRGHNYDQDAWRRRMAAAADAAGPIAAPLV